MLNIDRRFIVPTFQRDYEWTKGEQWSLLFDDLETASQRLESSREAAEVLGVSAARMEEKVSPHFLGAIVLDSLPSPTVGIDARAVIDGQQRLTTLQLLIRGVLDVLTLVDSRRCGPIRRMIENHDDVVEEPNDLYKLWPRRRDRAMWSLVMADDCTTTRGHPYYEARAYFRERAEMAIGTDASKNRSEVVADALLGLFKLVIIDLEPNDDAQAIFEVLNGRQTPLSATDLVKNLLFLKAELDNEQELEELYDRYWAEFDDRWWKVKFGTGHAARARSDLLLSCWLTSRVDEEVNVGRLYGEVRQHLSDQDFKIQDVLASLNQWSGQFKKIFESDETVGSRLADVYRRALILNVTTVLPLLTFLRCLPVTQLSQDDHLRSAVAIESWVVRRMLTGANTRGYGKRFVDVLRRAQEATESNGSVADAIEAALIGDADDLDGWPTDNQVEQAFLTSRFYGPVTQERIRMILGAIDHQMALDSPKGELPTFDYNKLQIEHVLPTKWQEHWAINEPDPDRARLKQQEREEAKNRIGNLTLLTEVLNPSISNGAWSVKRPALAHYSNLRLNSDLVRSENWSEVEIAARARGLAEVACRIWPRANACAPVSLG